MRTFWETCIRVRNKITTVVYLKTGADFLLKNEFDVGCITISFFLLCKFLEHFLDNFDVLI